MAASSKENVENAVEIIEDVSPLVKFFKLKNGDVDAQLALFNALIDSDNSGYFGSGILAISQHAEGECEYDCLISIPAVKYIQPADFMTELFEDRWWSELGASDIFCKHAKDVTDITGTVVSSKNHKTIVFTAKLKNKLVKEEIQSIIIFNYSTDSLEYHFIDEYTNVNDNHPIFVIDRESLSVVPLVRTVCTRYSLVHFKKVFGDEPTHYIQDNQFVAIDKDQINQIK